MRINEEIQAPKVRLIDENGENIGIVSRSEALEKAKNAESDLLEISPTTDPPVCKIMDYGKYKYEQQKKKAEAKKKQKTIEIKEIKIRPTIEDHDYQVKLKAMRKFIEQGNKVKISMRFRGREASNQELANTTFTRLLNDLGDKIKVEQAPKREGLQMIALIAPEATKITS